MEAFTLIQGEADALRCFATWFCIVMGKLVFPLATNGAWNFTGFNRVTLRGQQCLAESQEKKANKLGIEKNLAGKVTCRQFGAEQTISMHIHTCVQLNWNLQARDLP